MSPTNFQNQYILHNKTTFVYVIVILLIVGLACKQSKNTDLTPANQTATPKPSPTDAAFKSGGLGLDRATWESSHGKPLSEDGNFLVYENDKSVRFSESNLGNLKHIERIFYGNAIPIEKARIESKSLIPADAKFVRTFTALTGRTVDLYQSESLKYRFFKADFVGGNPGDFIVLYTKQAEKVRLFTITLGNEP